MKKFLVTSLCLALVCTGVVMLLPHVSGHDNSPATAMASIPGLTDNWAHVNEGDEYNGVPLPTGRGDGTRQNPYKIHNADDLIHATWGFGTLASNLAANTLNTNTINARGRHWILMNNITLTGQWTPRVLPPYSVFDGNNYSIHNLTIGRRLTDNPNTPNATVANPAFFSNMFGTIKNVTFENPSVRTTGSYVAIVASRVWNSPPAGWDGAPFQGLGRVSRFERVFIGTRTVPGEVRGASVVSGMIGEIFTNGIATIENSVNWANVTGTGGHVGGLVSRISPSTASDAEAIIIRSGNEGNVTGSTTSARANGIGGVVGCVCGGTATIEYSYNRGNVRGHGGLVGATRVAGREMIVRNSFNDSLVERSNTANALGIIAVQETATTAIRAENNWVNRDRFGNTGPFPVFVNRVSPANQELLAAGHTNGWYTANGNGWTRPGAYTGSAPYYNIATQGGPTGLDEFIRQLNQGIEQDPAFMVIGGRVELAASNRTTRIIQFDTKRAEINPYQIHVDPSASVTSFSGFPTGGTLGTDIGRRPWHTFEGWRLNGVGPLYNAGSPFALPTVNPTNRDTMVFRFEAQWTPIQIHFRDKTNNPHPDFVNSFSIGQPDVWLLGEEDPNAFWLIKMAKSSDYDILSNAKDFNLAPRITEDDAGIGARFLDNHVDFDGQHFITIDRMTENFDTTHWQISVSTNTIAGGTLRVSTGDNPAANAPSWPLMLAPGLDRGVSRGVTYHFHVEANPHYEIDEIIAGGVPVTILDEKNQSFTPALGNGFEIEIKFKRIPYAVNIGLDLVTSNTALLLPTKYELPEELLLMEKIGGDKYFEVSIANNINDRTNIELKALPRFEDGANVFRFISWNLWIRTSASGGIYIPISSEPVFEMNMLVNNSWLAEHLFEEEAILIIAEYAPLYTFYVDTYDDEFDVFPEDAENKSYGITYQLTHEVMPLGLGLNVAPEAATLSINVSMSLFASERHPSFLYEFVEFEGLELCATCEPAGRRLDDCDDEACEWHKEEGNQITATIRIMGNRAESKTIRPVFRRRDFALTLRTVAQSSGGATTELGLGIWVDKIGQTAATELRIGDTITALRAQSVSGYRFENRFTITHQCQTCVQQPALEVIVNNGTAGLIQNRPGGIINVDEDYLCCHTSRGRRITISAHYTRLLAFDVVADQRVGFVEVYRGTYITAPNFLGTLEDLGRSTLSVSNLERNEVITLVPIAKFGYEFSHYTYTGTAETPTGTPDGNNLIITMTGGRSVEAHFRSMRVSVKEELTHSGFGGSTSMRVWAGTDDEHDKRVLLGDERTSEENNKHLQLRTNDRIEIISTPDLFGSFGSKVNGWTINGLTYDQINTRYRNKCDREVCVSPCIGNECKKCHNGDCCNSVTVIGDMIRMTLTAEWYEVYGNKFEYHVNFGFTTEIWIIVMLIVLVMVLGFLLLAYFLNLQRKKRIIKTYLLADKRARASFNQADIVSGARAGKDISGVSKAAIKAALKAEKVARTGNTKPQIVHKAAPMPAPQPAPTPPPAPAPAPRPTPPPQAPAPAPQPTPMSQVLRPSQPAPAPSQASAMMPAPASLPVITPSLSGTRMLQDRRIVDGGGRVVATLHTDGTMADAAGKVFAKIRMSDGAIVGMNNKILGVVQGDGTIK